MKDLYVRWYFDSFFFNCFISSFRCFCSIAPSRSRCRIVHRSLSRPNATEIVCNCMQMMSIHCLNVVFETQQNFFFRMLEISSKRSLRWWHPTYLHVDVEKVNTMCRLVTIINFFNGLIVLDSKFRGNWTHLR